MSEGWRPKLAPGAQLTSLPLTAAEGFAVSRIDGHTTEHELSLLTGLPEDQVRTLLARLEISGVLEPRPVAAPAAAPAPAQVEAAPIEATLDTAEATEAAERADQPEPATPADAAAEQTTGATLLKLYRERFHGLPEADRAQLAATSNGAELSALCFDPLPSVIRKLLENPLCGVEQGRLIAAHHASSTGLEFLLLRADLSRDAEVQRKLWRNPQLAEGQVRRLTASKRLLELWKLNVSRESTAQTRSTVMKVLRSRFPAASAEERVELIFTTEGRCLAGLAGLPIDGRTTSLLCARTFTSMLLIQNIATWSVAPPALIAWLLKQPMVMRQPTLRRKLEQHPNAPSTHHR